MSARGRGKAGRGGWERKLPPLDCTVGRHDLADPELAGSTHRERMEAASWALQQLQQLPPPYEDPRVRTIARALFDLYLISAWREGRQRP